MDTTLTAKDQPADSAAAAGHARLYVLLGVMLLCWSANFIFAKIALRELPSLLVVSLRTITAGIAIWPVFIVGRQRSPEPRRPLSRRDLARLLALGVFGLIGNQVVFVIALERTSVAHSALITTLAPAFVLFGAAWLGHERVSRRKLLGMLIAAAGVALIQMRHSVSDDSSFLGDGLMIVSTMMFAGFTVLGKGAISEFGSLTVNTIAFAAGSVLLLPYTVWELGHFGLGRISLAAWLSVVYMGIFPSIVGYLIFAYALRRMPASRVSSVSYLQPVLATSLAVLFLGERPGATFALGAAFVLWGVWLAQGQAKARPA